MKQDLDQSDLVDKNAFLLSAVDVGSMFSNAEQSELGWVSKHSHVLLECGWELIEEVLVDLLQLLEGDVFKTERAGLHNTANIVFFDIEGQDF